MESSDILFIVIAFCVLWITAFVCWFVYQLAMLLKAINDVMQEVRWSIEKVEQAIQVMRGKMEAGTDHLGKVASSLKKTAESFYSSKKK